MEQNRKEPIKILFVDDESEITEFLNDFFRDKGYKPYVAGTGEKAIELVHTQNPNVVLLDIRLTGSPGKNDGIELLNEIKQYDAKIKVIMVTGVEDSFIINKAMELGASDYITKPLSLDYLENTVIAKVQEALSSKPIA